MASRIRRTLAPSGLPGNTKITAKRRASAPLKKFAVRLGKVRSVLPRRTRSGWSEQRMNLRALERAVVPRQVDLESAPRSQACNPPCGLRGGQCRRQADLCLVALQQHFSDCRRAAEVAVDLKGGGCASTYWRRCVQGRAGTSVCLRRGCRRQAWAQRWIRQVVAQPVAERRGSRGSTPRRMPQMGPTLDNRFDTSERCA
jgi:hypothetical protein